MKQSRFPEIRLEIGNWNILNMRNSSFEIGIEKSGDVQLYNIPSVQSENRRPK